jgi:O-antigen/teichoic acid export membrane protein
LLALCVALTLGGWGLAASLYVLTRGTLFQNLSPSLLALALAPLPFAIWSDAGRYLLNALNGLAAVNVTQLIGAGSSFAGALLLVYLAGGGVAGALVAVSFGSLAVGALTLREVLRRRAGGRLRVQRTEALALLRGGLRLHLNAVGTYLFTQASVLVLNYYRSPAETGLYQMATQLFSISLVFSSAIGTVAFGVVARAGPDGAWPEHRRLLAQALGAVGVLALVAYALAPFGVRLVAGERFLPAVPLFRLLLPALVGATFSSVMASQWIGRGLFVQAAALTLAVGIASVTCDLLLVPRYGMHGAAVSTLITYGISVVGNGGLALLIERRWRAARRVAVAA